jgi:hypothetical protein
MVGSVMPLRSWLVRVPDIESQPFVRSIGILPRFSFLSSAGQKLFDAAGAPFGVVEKESQLGDSTHLVPDSVSEHVSDLRRLLRNVLQQSAPAVRRVCQTTHIYRGN